MIDIEIVPAGAAPITVVKQAINLKKERKQIARASLTKVDFDDVYCVIDVEAPQAESLSRAIEKAKCKTCSCTAIESVE